MLKKELFFHSNTAGHYNKPRSLGFSAIFLPPKQVDAFNENGDLQVWAAITYCNKADKQFSKKIARAVLRGRAMELVRCRDVPKLLADAANKASSIAYHSYNDFASVLRHFL